MNKHTQPDRDLASATCTFSLDGNTIIDRPSEGVVLHSGIRKDCTFLRGEDAVNFWGAFTAWPDARSRSDLVEDVFSNGLAHTLARFQYPRGEVSRPDVHVISGNEQVEDWLRRGGDGEIPVRLALLDHLAQQDVQYRNNISALNSPEIWRKAGFPVARTVRSESTPYRAPSDPLRYRILNWIEDHKWTLLHVTASFGVGVITAAAILLA